MNQTSQHCRKRLPRLGSALPDLVEVLLSGAIGAACLASLVLSFAELSTGFPPVLGA